MSPSPERNRRSPHQDPRRLAGGQYRDSRNLDARARLHRDYGTESEDWHHWVFRYLHELPDEARILEVGCGPAWLWRSNAERVPAGWRLLLTDLSSGMVREARRHMGADSRYRFAVAAAGEQPLPDDSVDAIVANHMLYHVPDLDRALSELRRVLRPDGRLLAATNGEAHMRELQDLVREIEPGSRGAFGDADAGFRLETGGRAIARHFDQFVLERHEAGLQVPEAGPLVDYVASVEGWLDGDQLAAFRKLVTSRIAEQGPIQIQKDSGLFIAG